MKLDWKILVVGIASLIIGAYINDRIYKKRNEELLAQLKSELASSNQNTARLSGAEKIQAEIREKELNAQIKTFKNLKIKLTYLKYLED